MNSSCTVARLVSSTCSTACTSPVIEKRQIKQKKWKWSTIPGLGHFPMCMISSVVDNPCITKLLSSIAPCAVVWHFICQDYTNVFLLICKEPNRTDEEWCSVLCGGGAREHGGRKPPSLWERQKPEILWIAQRVGSSSLCVLSVHQSKCPIPSHSISLCIVCVYVCAFEWEQFISGTNISPRHRF